MALGAAKTSFETKPPVADGDTLAPAYGATLWTQHADFEGMADVRVRGEALSTRPSCAWATKRGYQRLQPF